MRLPMLLLMAIGTMSAQTTKPAKTVWPKVAGHAQGVITPEQQAAFPGNAWMKPCGPDNHDEWCVQSGKQEKPPVEPTSTNVFTFSPAPPPPIALATLSQSGGFQVYRNQMLVAECSSTGEWPHEKLSNCVLSEGHTLSEVLQVWLDTHASDSDIWNDERKDQERRYEELWQAFHDYVKQSENDLRAIQDALHGNARTKPKPAPTK